MSLSPILLQASELGIRLEIVNGLPIWEAQPVYRHQKHIERIVQGITKTVNVHNQDVNAFMPWMYIYSSLMG